jgi:hypothetical protein
LPAVRKETTRKTKRRWVDDSKMDLVDIGRGGVDGVGLAQDKDRRRAL